ncbi:Pumilio like [Actinidia chinensis var. chinensis]|uniref:S-protein homolog n=1 Tax=Actinidia chinensis var. chinensis TaxID=1590841 RepID=A0A2R6S0B2_ACTCC|nr:Pumilio like [Actinidia chinensis var. chinensis]
MPRVTMRWFFLSLVIVGFHLVCASDDLNHVPNISGSLWDATNTVHIISRVPNNPTPLQVRCQSRDNDFGMHTLYNGQEFHWAFTENFFGTTLYFCHFYWGSEDKSFAVYDTRLSHHCPPLAESNYSNCYWEARPDGFYLSGDNQSWEKINNWT